MYDCGTDRVAAARNMTLVDTKKRTTATFADLAVDGLQDEILLVADIFTLAKQFVATAINIAARYRRYTYQLPRYPSLTRSRYLATKMEKSRREERKDRVPSLQENRARIRYEYIMKN